MIFYKRDFCGNSHNTNLDTPEDNIKHTQCLWGKTLAESESVSREVGVVTV